MSRFHLPRKTVENIKCRSTTSRCLNKTAVSRVLSCGAREASTSRIANRARPKPGEQNLQGWFRRVSPLQAGEMRFPKRIRV